MYDQSNKTVLVTIQILPPEGYLPLPLAINMYIIVIFKCLLLKKGLAIFTWFHMGPSVERVLTISSNGSAPKQDNHHADIW